MRPSRACRERPRAGRDRRRRGHGLAGAARRRGGAHRRPGGSGERRRGAPPPRRARVRGCPFTLRVARAGGRARARVHRGRGAAPAVRGPPYPHLRVTTIPYRIRRSERARRARILVDGDGVEVVVPRRFPLREVEPFVEEKRAWIERTLRRLRETEAELAPSLLEDGGRVPYLGESLRLAVRVEPGRQRDHVARRGEELRVALPPDPQRAPLGGQLPLLGAEQPP